MTYSIACPETRKKLWIGQYSSSLGAPYIYTAEEKTMAALGRFLAAHVGMPLVFDYDECLDDYTDPRGWSYESFEGRL